MKKILLFTFIINAVALNSMNEPKLQGHYTGLGDLSPEIQVMIIQTLQSYDKLNDIIKAIKAMSLTNQQLKEVVDSLYGNQKGFSKIVHLLAQKFNKTPEEIVKQFNTATSKKYIELNNDLVFYVRKAGQMKFKDVFDTITKLLHEGADVNYFAKSTNFMTPLLQATMNLNPDLVQLLLEQGADPNIAHHYHGTALDFVKKISKYQASYKTKEIIELLEKAMNR